MEELAVCLFHSLTGVTGGQRICSFDKTKQERHYHICGKNSPFLTAGSPFSFHVDI